MIEEILEGIAIMLAELYPNIDRYDSYPESDFLNNSFVVTCTGGSFKKRISTDDTRFGFDNLNLNISYFNNDARKLTSIVEELKIRIDTIKLPNGDRVRIYNKRSYVNIPDNHSSFTFSMRVSTLINRDTTPRMNSLSYSESLLTK